MNTYEHLLGVIPDSVLCICMLARMALVTTFPTTPVVRFCCENRASTKGNNA